VTDPLTGRRTAPRTGFPFLDEPAARGHVVAMAHRGGRARPGIGENTVTAFRAAVELGYRYLETDVHATRDGELVAFHDAVLDRVTDRVGPVAELSYAQLAAVLVGGTEPIPRLVDLLETFPHARFNVDLKTMACVEPMADVVRRTGASERLCVGSFSEPVLRRFRTAAGDAVLTGCGVAAAAALAFAPAGRLLTRLLRDTGAVLQVPRRHRGLRVVDRGLVRRAHADGRHVHVWTVNDRAEMGHLLDLGVDGMISDRIDVLRDVLVERGQWEGAP
jgi:glycerophosphoryl diester phosphodiesterase